MWQISRRCRQMDELFTASPEWLVKQLKVCRQNPERHFGPLCTAVAAVVLEDGTRGPEVAASAKGSGSIILGGHVPIASGTRGSS
jgi:hypothetical protein